jgi:hypothetical protein
MKLLGIMTPLYLGRVASFINYTRDMSSQEAEEVVREQAQVFEELKPYLVKVWEDEPHSQRAEAGLAKHS